MKKLLYLLIAIVTSKAFANGYLTLENELGTDLINCGISIAHTNVDTATPNAVKVIPIKEIYIPNQDKHSLDISAMNGAFVFLYIHCNYQINGETLPITYYYKSSQPDYFTDPYGIQIFPRNDTEAVVTIFGENNCASFTARYSRSQPGSLSSPKTFATKVWEAWTPAN